MTELDLHEQEQIEAFKAWWKRYGNGLIGVILLVALAFAGNQYWRQHQAKKAAEAAKLYEAVLQQKTSGDPKRISDAAEALVKEYASTAYAPLAQLLAAEANLQAGDTARAKAQLQWVIEHANEGGLQHAARLKLVGILLDEKQYNAALQQLKTAHPASFDGLYLDLEGEVLLAQGKPADARTAWQQALDKLGAQSPYRNLVQMKLDGLGGAQ